MAGLEQLLKASEALPLVTMQLFSSISATLGNPGQANYGAANAALDAIATEMQVRRECDTTVVRTDMPTA